jgi:nitroreductase
MQIMEFQKLINQRHSIREYENKRVPRSIIKEIIESAVKAPSACNRQPWIFYSVDKQEKRNKIAKILKSILKIMDKQIKTSPKEIQKITYNFYSDLGGAQNIIFIFRKISKNEAEYVKPGDIASISCAAENLMLSAVDFGLGTCWVGSFNGPQTEKMVREVIGARKDEELMASIIIGYPKKGYIPLKREKKKLKEVLRFV